MNVYRLSTAVISGQLMDALEAAGYRAGFAIGTAASVLAIGCALWLHVQRE